MWWFSKHEMARRVSGVLVQSLEQPFEDQFKRIEGVIMATREELTGEITEIKNLVVKSREEWRKRVDGLETKLNANQPITLEDLADLKREVKTSDDENADVADEQPPVTGIPPVEAPATDVPPTEAPPVTGIPGSEPAPATDVPPTEAPSADAPVTETPAPADAPVDSPVTVNTPPTDTTPPAAEPAPADAPATEAPATDTTAQ